MQEIPNKKNICFGFAFLLRQSACSSTMVTVYSISAYHPAVDDIFDHLSLVVLCVCIQVPTDPAGKPWEGWGSWGKSLLTSATSTVGKYTHYGRWSWRSSPLIGQYTKVVLACHC